MLRVVLWINLAMFIVEFGARLIAYSTALLADSVDMLGMPSCMASAWT